MADKPSSLSKRGAMKLNEEVLPMEKSQMIQDNDRISKLPDDILHQILASVMLYDAASTSMLSRRWRYLVTSLPNLNLDIPNLFRNVYDTLGSNSETVFVEIVNQILHHHMGTGVNKFRVGYFMSERLRYNLDNWLSFAIDSCAKEIDIDLFSATQYVRPYDFPCHLFANLKGSLAAVTQISLRYCTFKPDANFDGLKCLRDLALRDVCITDTEVTNILSALPALDQLKLHYCHQLVNLSISNRSGRLKYLSVYHCEDLKRIELYCTNLASFDYEGGQVSFDTKRALNLKRASVAFRGDNPGFSDYIQTKLACDLPALDTLMLMFDNFSVEMLSSRIQQLMFLKHLIFAISTNWELDILWVANLLAIAPYLEKLHIQLFDLSSNEVEEERNIHRPEKVIHKNLKIIEISGFTAQINQVELVLHLINSGPALEVFTIDTRRKEYAGDCTFTSPVYTDHHLDNPGAQRWARIMADEYLHGQIPPWVKLVY